MQEELLQQILMVSHIVAQRWNHSLKADEEDIEQDICIYLIQMMGKKTTSGIKDLNSYLMRIAENYSKLLLLEEHKRGEWITSAYEDIDEIPCKNYTTAYETEIVGGNTIVVDDYVREQRMKRNSRDRRHYDTIKDTRNARRRELYAKRKLQQHISQDIL